jgi:hypothetical protein
LEILSIIIYLIALYIVISGIYYLIQKEKMKRWSKLMKIYFYSGFIVCSIVVIWAISSTIYNYTTKVIQ